MFTPSKDGNDHRAHQALETLIKQEADRSGVLPFARFMDLALYSPGLGFYQRSGNVIGQKGDFFTSVSVGPLFGELLACQFEHWLEVISPEKPVIVEAGAHDGRLALDILNSLRAGGTNRANRLEYWILEPSRDRREWQARTLHPWLDRVRWFDSWTDLSSFCDTSGQRLTGVVFGNELLDAFPVHRVKWNRAPGKWTELGVRWDRGQFVPADMPLSAPVVDYAAAVGALATGGELLWPAVPSELLDALPDGFVTECCPAALNWWQQAATTLDRGVLITVDYGLEAHEFFTPQRAAGTVRGYRNHQPVDNLLADPGLQDLTAQVNFGLIKRVGESAGMRTDHYTSQSSFLTRIAQRLSASSPAFSPAETRQFHTLTHPHHLGRSFKVLAQSRGLDNS